MTNRICWLSVHFICRYTDFGTAFSIHISVQFMLNSNSQTAKTFTSTKDLLYQLFVWLLFVCFSLVAHHAFVPTSGQHLSLAFALVLSFFIFITSICVSMHCRRDETFICETGHTREAQAQAQTEDWFFLNHFYFFGIQYQEMVSNEMWRTSCQNDH